MNKKECIMTKEILAGAKTLWNYHLLHHTLKPADCILVLGSHDLRVAERAAELYEQKLAPLVIMSGGLGNLTQHMWTEKEADKFAAIAVKAGVPPKDILIENQSTNTGENILFTQKLLKEKGLAVQTAIVVQKPYMERRTFATIRKQWPELNVQITSPQLSFEEYPNDEIPVERVVNVMVGDLQRIIEYPALGFQIPQEVPEAVLQVYQFLRKNGFDKHLIPKRV